MGTKVILTSEQHERAIKYGLERYNSSRAKKLKPAFEYKNEEISISYDVNGAGAEIAFAQFKGDPDFIPPVDNFKNTPDVGEYEVRSSNHPNPRLRIQQKDFPTRKFVFVKGAAPNYEIVGWIYGLEGQKAEYWRDPNNSGRFAFFIPLDKLRKFD